MDGRADSPGLFPGGPRFRLVRQLGEGGMGVVYEVEDRERGEHVALKTIRRPTAELTYRLKREFRELAGLHHPNLVTLHELFVDGEHCYFTMELLVGVDFLAHLRGMSPRLPLADTPEDRGSPGSAALSIAETLPTDGTPGCDEARLRRLLPQLARGLAALHGAGMVHRDVKPSNLVVTSEGRLVLVDFGLVTHAEEDRRRSEDGHVVGTVAYMAPEQARGDPASAASDWYAAGVVLFEALTGQVPFTGPPLRVLVDKQQHPAPPPRALAPAVPRDLDALCTSLLSRNEAERPDAAAVLRQLGAAAPTSPPPPAVSASMTVPFAGRDRELARLLGALPGEHQAAVVLVTGESGIGKSTLVRRFIEGARVRRPELVVLEGRCFERESVAYHALDSLIDHLSSFWRSLPAREAAELVPREASLLPRLFPVLGRVPAVSGAPAGRPIADPQEVRTRAFAALREVVGRLADRRPLVLSLDDMQWSDGNTLLLLSDLMRPPDPPALLLVLSSRPEGAQRLQALVGQMAVPSLHLELDALSAEASLQLARHLLGPEAGRDAERVAREAGGNPFFIGELVQHVLLLGETSDAPVALEAALRRRIEQLPSPTRGLLELVALAGEPIGLEPLGAAAGLAPAEIARETGMLRTLRLARSSGGRRETLLEPYHDRIREAVLAGLTSEARSDRFRQLATSAGPEAAPERLARYWSGAGEPARAAAYAVRAADEAVERFDFDRAASLFGFALGLGVHDREGRRALLEALGGALSHAGRPADAALAFGDAACDATDEVAALELRRRSAEELLRGGYLVEGLQAIAHVLEAIGLRLSSPGRALAAMLARRALLRLRGLGWRPRAASELPQRRLTELDACWSVTLGLSVVDNIQSAAYSARHLALALATGEPTRLARAFGMEAVFLASQGQGRRARRCVARCRELTRDSDDLYGQAWAEMGEAATRYFVDNAWRSSLTGFAEAERRFRASQGAGWEVDSAQTWGCFNRLYLGELHELAHLVPAYVREAERRGDLYQEVNLRTRLTMVWLAEDDAASASRSLEEAIEAWLPGQAAFQVQHFFALHGRAEVALYLGRPEAAASELAGRWSALRRSMLLRVRMVDAEAAHLRGRVALAVATAPGCQATERRRALLEARACAGRLRRIGSPLASGWAALLEAGAARADGDDARSMAWLRRGVAALDALETRLYEHAARHRLGELCGGQEGARLRAEAAAYFAEHRVRRPDRLVALLVPGWPERAS